MAAHIKDIFSKLLAPLVSVECLESLICYNWIVSSIFTFVVVEASGEPVHVLHHMSEDLYLVAKRFWKWFPNPFHGLFFETLISVFIVYSCKNPWIETHVCKKSRICVRVTKWIHVPAYCGDIVELFFQELMPNHHVVHHIIIVSACLIVHWPTCIDEFETVLFNKLSNLILQLRRLSVEPHRKEFHLDIGKPFVFIFEQLINHIIEDLLDFGYCNTLFHPWIIFIWSFEPTDVVMGMCDQVDI